MPTPAPAQQTAKTQAASPQRSTAARGPQAGVPERLGISRLQRAAGNRTIHRLLRTGGVHCPMCESKQHRETDKEGASPDEDERVIRAKRASNDPPAVSSGLEAYLARSRGGGVPLAASTRAFFEPRFGYNLGQVRLHTDSRASQAAGDVRALAFTTGSDIYFAQGQFKPGTREGDRLLGHELTHVLQQSVAPGLPIQRVADKSNVPPMDCTPDAGPGAPVGTNIMFGESDRVLDLGDKGQIATDHTAWLARGGIDTFIVEGFASSEGAARDNWLLSCDRAKAVKAELVGLLVPAGMVTAIAHGETEEFSTTARPPNRRAVVRTAAGTPPSVTIFPVLFFPTLNRVPPGRTVPVLVLASGVPAGRNIDLDIQGSGGTNGTATVAPATIAGMALVDVTGGIQTTPGSAGNLFVRARIGGLTLATSPGFTVAAHPRDWNVTLNSDLNTATHVGLLANNAWDSDGTGGVAELDQVQRGEAIAAGRQDRPPFFATIGTPSGKSAGNLSPRVDTHGRARANIRTSAFLRLLGTRFIQERRQLFIFDDARTGLVNQTAVNSGFTLTDTVSFNAGRGGWDHQLVKTGAAVTVGARSSAAASGTATSLVHPL